MIRGLNHLTLAVRDLDAAFAFYADVLGLRPVVRWGEGAYFEAGALWLALTRDDATRAGPLPEYTHVAFDVAPGDFEALRARVLASGCAVWQENASEGDSVYFLDPDGHKLEIHASTLAARVEAMRTTNRWPDAVYY